MERHCLKEEKEGERETPGLLWFVTGTIRLQGRRAFWFGHNIPKGGEENVERKTRER